MDTLGPDRVRRLDEWLGSWRVRADLSWPLQDTLVLRVQSPTGEHIVKAARQGRPVSHHFRREIDAHRGVLRGAGLPVPQLEHDDEALGLIVTRFIPGELVEGTDAEGDPAVYEQAGRILSRLLGAGSSAVSSALPPVSDTYADELAAATTTLVGRARGLVSDDRLDALGALVRRLRADLPSPVRLHATHGDFQPRNWIVHEGRVSLIDFGRAAQRSWVSDLVRLRQQQLHGRPDLAEAFHRGLDRPLSAEDRTLLALETAREGVGTVVWAHGIGDEDFESHGRRMIDRILGGDLGGE